MKLQAKTAYLAARFSRRDELKPYIDELAQMGIGCTSRWITDEPSGEGLSKEDYEALLKEWANKDLNDVASADMIVSFTEAPDDKVPGRARGGRHVEFGLGLAWAVSNEPWSPRLVVIGHLENIFHYLDVVEFFPTWEEFIAEEKMRRM